MSTTTLLGVLRIEQTAYPEADHSVAGARTVTAYRPAGVATRNDGFRGYWMLAGYNYQLRHDGTGWRVAQDIHYADHILRLVDAQDGRAYVSELPVEGGSVAFEVGRTYELREQTYGVWEIHQM